MTNSTVLHIIQRLTRGGAARSMLATAQHSTRDGVYRHSIVSLLPADHTLVAGEEARDITIHNSPDKHVLWQEMAQADIVHVHFWNTPELYALLRADLPPTRLVLCPHIGGLHAPQVITRALVEFADLVLTVSPFSYHLDVFESVPVARRAAKVAMIYDVADLRRVATSGKRQAGHTFNVGYIGTLSPVKMHPHYVSMSARISIPNVRFILCGNPADYKPLLKEAAQSGIADRLDFRGYVEEIAPIVGELDVFGYPLCPDNYSAADLVLQEVMAAGVPPVVFPHGGTHTLVQHDRTGLIVASEDEYARAIDYLHAYPAERRRLGETARAFAWRHFGVANTMGQIHALCDRLLAQPKRTRALADTPASSPGAALFVASLGLQAGPFRTSLDAPNLAELLAAEQLIANSSPVVCAEGGGGIFHYRNAYQHDGHLRLWSGLALMGQGQHVRALAEFQAAIALGCDHWRVSWYLAQMAAYLHASALVIHALNKVVETAPDFFEGRQMLEQWTVRAQG